MSCHCRRSCCCRRGPGLVDSFDVEPAQPYDGPIVTPTGAVIPDEYLTDRVHPGPSAGVAYWSAVRPQPRLPDPFPRPRPGVVRRLVRLLRPTRR